MNRKEKLGRIFLVLLSLFVVMLGYGILLPTLPYYTEKLALKDNLDTDLINFHIGMLTTIGACRFCRDELANRSFHFSVDAIYSPYHRGHLYVSGHSGQ